ncbi:glucan endo-1,3-beta-glucosidase 4 precursor [Zea mays]|uniref:Glucan endo-1,3-beta-glucosidase 4 n=1 Tax=Zea mays TaxID=4577 RepID=B6SMZ3_MAIZE|nr:glucan endo-1,3-beta-glucosidase 4 precursor [Zea mays]ACG26226.1 glucan endo-1,3-beta-glucosidase 4 precursor [Zea mays]AQL06096.1 Glucan endo-1,3-beta-glucosidase 4 [Zea mays]|eukprot:NP_001147226.1 glucan endo-1,3-beta-glucosidase 4 precursor [Zea mays]
MEASSLALVAAVLLLSSTLAASDFCVCSSDQPTAVLQKAIDFACGPQGGADCTAILQGGGCYSPNTVAAHCSWAANSYYQNNKARGATCDFGGAAAVSTTDPSFSGCTFASSATSAGAGTGTAGTTTGTTTAGGATTGTLSPGVGIGGLNGTGMGGSTGLGPADNTLDAAAPGLLPGAASLAAAAAALSLLALLQH